MAEMPETTALPNEAIPALRASELMAVFYLDLLEQTLTTLRSHLIRVREREPAEYLGHLIDDVAKWRWAYIERTTSPSLGLGIP